MEKINITSNLKTMVLRCDYTIVCKDIRSAVVNHCEDGMVQWGVELTNPVEYTKDEALAKYGSKAKVIKWVDTYTEDGHEAMAVVLEK